MVSGKAFVVHNEINRKNKTNEQESTKYFLFVYPHCCCCCRLARMWAGGETGNINKSYPWVFFSTTGYRYEYVDAHIMPFRQNGRALFFPWNCTFSSRNVAYPYVHYMLIRSLYGLLLLANSDEVNGKSLELLVLGIVAIAQLWS